MCRYIDTSGNPVDESSWWLPDPVGAGCPAPRACRGRRQGRPWEWSGRGWRAPRWESGRGWGAPGLQGSGCSGSRWRRRRCDPGAARSRLKRRKEEGQRWFPLVQQLLQGWWTQSERHLVIKYWYNLLRTCVLTTHNDTLSLNILSTLLY